MGTLVRLGANSTVKVVGLGGVGSIVARYAALFLGRSGGAHRLVLVDGDEFESGNASRMFFDRLGGKAEILGGELVSLVGDALTVVPVGSYVDPGNVGTLIHEGDVVLLAVDNHATRKCVSDHCARLADVCLVSGGNDPVGKDASGRVLRGTFGNVQAFVRRDGADVTPALTHMHPEISNPADRLPTDQSCTELAVSQPQILFTNLATASAMLSTFWLFAGGELGYGELCFDIHEALMRPTHHIEKAASAASRL